MTERSDGHLLALTDVSVGPPTHQVAVGETWQLSGRHVLVVAEVIDQWAMWVGQLTPGSLLLPYPGPYATLSLKAEESRLVLVQPDRYLAGHILDKHAAVHGPQSVKRLQPLGEPIRVAA